MRYLIITIFNLISILVHAQNMNEIDYYKSLCNSFRFEDYKVIAKPFANKIAELDTKTVNDLPPDIISNILDQYNNVESPNFSGYYIIISWGCGSPCQMNAIIDSRTGKIEETFATSNGLNFKKNSNLLILDPPDKSVFDKQYRAMIGAPKFYIWKENKLEKIK